MPGMTLHFLISLPMPSSAAWHGLQKTYTQSVAKGRLSETQKSERFGRIKGATNMASLRDADLIIEAVFEDRELKKQVFAELDGICRPGAILAFQYLDPRYQ